MVQDIERSVKRIALRAGAVLALLASLPVGLLTGVAVPVTLIAGGGTRAVMLVAACVLALIWGVMLGIARLITGRICRLVSGGPIADALECAAGEIGRIVALALSVITGVLTLIAVLISGSVVAPIIAGAVITGAVWLIIRALARAVALKISRIIMNRL